MTDRENRLAKYFQDHKDDEGEWEQTPEAVLRKPASVVYSVRFSPKELIELRRAAERKRIVLSELIRSSVIQHIREPAEARIEVGAPRAKFFSQTELPTAGTKGASVLESPFKPEVATVASA